MTSSDSNWGERREARRNHRRWAVAAVGVVVMIAFGFGGPYVKALGSYVAPSSEAADAGSLIWSIGLLTAGAVIWRLQWLDLDEIQRRHIVNAVAIAGLTSMALLLLAQAAGRILPVAEPMMAVILTTTVAFLTALIFQRLRA